jgi:DHA1 family multidrug resistance protein-like MFS transporter
MPQPQWRKNQIAVTITVSLQNFGYYLIMPFLPIYVRQLGIGGVGEIAFWSGLITGISPLLASFTGTFWGRLGDRHGMKVIAVRAAASNTFFYFMMALCQNVWQLLLVRTLLGLGGGFQNVSVALVTQYSPREKVPSIIGNLQSFQILSAALGPFVGGILASSIGIRNTFLVNGILNVAALLSVIFLYGEQERSTKTFEKAPAGPGLSGFWRQPEYFTSLLILFFVNMADRTFGPIIPLFLEQLGTPATRVAVVSGSVISAAAFGEAFSAWVSGKLAARVSLRRLITGRLVFSILVLLPMIFVTSPEQFSVLRVVLALLAGGTLTLALSAAHRVIPEERRGSGFGLLSSVSMFGTAVGPLIAGAIAGISLRAIFVTNSIIYFVMILFVARNVTAKNS